MPYADPDKQKEAMKLIMRKRRAEQRERRKKVLAILKQEADVDGEEKQA